MNTFPPPPPGSSRIPILCRNARLEDTADVLELTRTIWEGDDYVPRVWPDWLADRDGRLAVAEYEGRVVGLSKLTRHTNEDWWLEGLRVHPEYEGRGIASQLHDCQLAYCRQQGGRALRLATASFRFSVQHLCERTGFRKAGEFSPFTATPLLEPADDFTPLAVEEAPAALAFARQCPTLALSGGLVDLSWAWTPLSQSALAAAAAEGRAWWWLPGGERGLLAVVEDKEETGGSRTPYIQLAACTMEALPGLLAAYRRLAGSRGYPRAAWNAPLRQGLEDTLQACGYQRSWDASIFVYEKLMEEN